MNNTRMALRSVWNAVYERPAEWLQRLATDKLLHFMVSYVIMEIASVIFKGWMGAFALTLGIGVFKEVVIDKWLRKTKVDYGDLLADLLGAVACFLVIQLMIMLYQFIYK